MSTYPSYIHVTKLKDLFWNNNSDLYPTSAPVLNLYRRKSKTRPVFHSPYTATVVLTGDYNHSYYGGRYYFLTKLEVLDVEKGKYKYQMDYDVMLNFMTVGNGGRIKGTIVRTNNKKILEESIQTTVPIIVDPTDIHVFNTEGDEDVEWQRNVIRFKDLEDTITKAGTTGFLQQTISVADWTFFVQRVRENYLAKKTKGKTWLPGTYSTVYYNPHQHTNPLLIFDYLPTKVISTPWKNEALGYIISFLSKQFLWTEKKTLEEQKKTQDEITQILKDKFKTLSDLWQKRSDTQLSNQIYKKFVITKQSGVQDHFNEGKYVVSLEDEAAGGTIQSDVYIERIDLSGLIDIIPLNARGEVKEPDTQPDLKTHLVDVVGEASPIDQFIYRLDRKVYLPINSPKNQGTLRRCIKTRVSSNFDLCSIDEIRSEPPQRIEFKDRYVSRVGGKQGSLWYLNKNNFALVSYDGQHRGKKWSDLSYGGEKTILRPYVQLSNANVTWGQYYWWFFYDHKFKDLLPLGFAMYIISRNPLLWNDFEYLGDSNITNVHYINNIHEKAISKFESLRWTWKLDGFDTNNLLGLNNFQKYWLLELDRMTWLTLIPTQKGINYKWMDKDEYGIWRYFPNATWNDWQWIARLPHLPISKADRVLNSPYGRNDIASHVRERFGILDDITLKGTITPKTPIKKGDIFTTSIEHELQEVDFLYNLPFELDSNEIFDILNHRYQYDERGKKAYLPSGGVKKQVHPQEDPEKKKLFLVPFLGWGALLGYEQDYFKWLKAPLGDQVKFSAPSMDSFLHRRPVFIPNDLNTLILYLYNNTWKLGILSISKGNKLSLNDEGIIDTVEGTKTVDIQTIQISNVENGSLDYNLEQSNIFNETIQKAAFSEIIARIQNSPNGRIFNYTSNDFKTLDLTFDLVGTDWYLLITKGKTHLIPKPNTNLIKKIPSQSKISKIPVNIPDTVDIFSKINQKAELVFYGQSLPLNVKFTGGENSNLIYRAINIKPEGDDGMEYYNFWGITEADTIDTWLTIPSQTTRAVAASDSTQSFIFREKLSNLAMDYENDRIKNRLFLDSKQEFFSRQRQDLNWQKEDAAWNIAFKSAQTLASGAVAGASAIGGAASLGTAGAVGLGAAAIGSAASSASSLYGSIQFLIRHPQLLERVNVDERNLILQNTQSLFQRKQNYESDFAVQTLKLNKGANSFIKPTTSRRDIQTKYNQLNDYKNINIRVCLPNTSQRKEINHIYETFGCECVYNSDFISISNNMDPILIKFSRISSGEVFSEITTDLTLRDIIIQTFQNGLKFENVIHEIIQEAEEDERITTPTRGVDTEFDTENIPEWSKEKWTIFRIKNSDKDVIKAIKRLDKYGLTKEEFDKYINQIRRDTDAHLLADISAVISQRGSGTQIDFPDDPDIQDIRAGALLVATQKELEECKKKGETLSTNINTLSAEKSALEEELRQCRINITNLNQAKNTCDLISARKIKELEEKIKEKQIEVDAAKVGLTASVNRANTLSDQYKRLEEQKKQAENVANLYKQEADTLKRDKTNLSARITALEGEVKEKENLENEKANIERQLRECLEKTTTPSAQAQRLQKVLDACRAANKALQNTNRNIQQRLREQNTNLLEKQRTLTAEKMALESEKIDLETKIKDLESQVERSKGSAINIPFNLCEIMKKMAHSSKYSIDLRARENGFSLFSDLCFELARTIKWIRMTDSESYLAKYEIMRPVFKLLQDLERIPVIDKCEDVIGYRGWSRFVNYIENNARIVWDRETNLIKSVTDKIIDTESLSSLPSIHAVWDVLDEINYAIYRAHATLSEEIKTDRDLENFFSHAFPGQRIKSMYEQFFNIPTEFSTVKKTLLELTCPSDEGNQQTFIDAVESLIDGVKHKILPPTVLPTPTIPILDDGYMLNQSDIFSFANYESIVSGALVFKGLNETKKAQIPYAIMGWSGLYSPPDSFSDKNNKYTIDGTYYRRSGLRYYEFKGDVYTPAVSLPFYYRIAIKKPSDELFSEILTARNNIWKNRNNITLPKDVQASIDGGSFFRQIAVRNWDLKNKKVKDEQINVDLVKLFGKKGAKDALILLSCLDAFKQWWEPVKTVNGDLLFLLSSRNTVENIEEYLDPKQRTWAVIGENEFLDSRSLLNFLYRHITLHPSTLLDTLEPLRFIFRKIYTAAEN